jgi:hypothetical protein
MQIDHVFVAVEGDVPDSALAPLVPSFRRVHAGQGTANVCYCFDNAYLEILWPIDAAELASGVVSRTRLADRARWRKNGASPLGIGLRDIQDELPFATWTYRMPGLPEGTGIAVAVDSDDPRQPFIFASPGTARPDAWTDGLAGERQSAAGLAEIVGVELEGQRAGPAIRALEEARVLTFRNADQPRMVLTLSRRDGGPRRRLSLPDFAWLA